ncbi:hypothetical protein EO244_03420 [Ancylomarina salipaludis]|uniref:Uncharacterized protein n=1 Tax=Ancylomarina salipaludis TaxID=2501299 RepID=A0A4Q1JQY5_9BACT|nr:hypothetical protein [Ancylomarina salipaludis]RXQ96691.1 hypothetical protein EO244_03420 [Ancylomarina salipaludis]
MRIILVILLSLVLNACHRQDYKVEEQILNRIYESGRDNGLDLEHEYTEFKKFLLTSGFLKDDSGSSYYRIYKRIADEGRVNNYFEYNFLDTIKYHAKDTSIGFKKILSILRGPNEAIKKRCDLDYKKSRQYLLDKAMDSLVQCNTMHPGFIAKAITKVLTVQDFEHDYYKMMAMCTFAITADVVPYPKQETHIPEHALRVFLDAENKLIVNDGNLLLDNLPEIVYKYVKNHKDSACVTLKSSGYSSYKIFLSFDRIISKATDRLRKEKALSDYGKEYDELELKFKNLIDNTFSVEIIDLDFKSNF